MIDFVDEVPHSNDILYYITETVDTQGNKAYRIELATEVTPGTPMNKVLFDSIKDDLTNLQNNKLNISSKATQAQAEAGTDNTNYMTSLRVKNAIKVNKIIVNNVSLSDTANNTINLSQYLTTNKVEIPLNIRFSSNYTSIRINGSKIRHNTGGSSTSAPDYINIAESQYIQYANLKIEIYPTVRSFSVIGEVYKITGAQTGTATNIIVSDIYSYDSLTSIELGKVNYTYSTENPLSIIQYKV